MNNDLISREYIKLFVCEYEKFNGKETEIVKAVPIQAIDNAPTVELTETEMQEVLNKRCMTAVANEYLIALHGKRQTGEWVVDEFGRKICGKCQFPFAEFQSDNYCSLCGANMRKGEEEC